MKNLLVIALILLISENSNAQGFGNKLKEKFINTLENKTEQKVEDKTNRAYDGADKKVEDSFKNENKGENNSSKSSTSKGNSSQQSDEDVQKMLDQMLNGSSGVTFEEQDLSNVQPSKFIGSFTMTFETVKNGAPVKNGAGEMQYFIDAYQLALIPTTTEGETSRIIMDRKTGQMTMLTTDKKGKKSGIKMKMPKIVIGEELQEEIDNQNVKITVTNEKKTIEGFTCTKVLMDGDDYNTVAWVTNEKNISLYDIFNFLSISKKDNNSKNDQYAGLSGLALEAISRDKKTGEIVTTKVKNLKVGSVSSSAFSTAGFEVMDMSNLMNFSK